LIRANLDLGGFGISRYLIDFELKKTAASNGVLVLEDTKVSDVVYLDDAFQIQFQNNSVNCRVAVGAFGKRSNLDVKWRRHFVQKKTQKLDNYIGVKYHIKTEFPADTIALHNFKDGYCGISKIEGDAYCLCYLTTAQNLKDCNNSIKTMEEMILFKNPWLKQIFTTAEFLFPEPVTISQISFDKKALIENHVLMCGDAAGMITPLCGNGMSMALHTAKILAGVMEPFLKKGTGRAEMEMQFKDAWKNQFQSRLRVGRWVQALFGREKLTNFFIGALQPFPFAVSQIIKATHGTEF
jgi:flavin-dependent dehydrogenase